MPRKKNTTQDNAVVKNLIYGFKPNFGNSSTNPVTTVSMRTICERM
jgi:hypothetical protein